MQAITKYLMCQTVLARAARMGNDEDRDFLQEESNAAWEAMSDHERMVLDSFLNEIDLTQAPEEVSA